MAILPYAKPDWDFYNIYTTGPSANPELELFEHSISEYVDISGWPITYFQVKSLDNLDPLYGEDPNIDHLEGKLTKFFSADIYEVTDINTQFGMIADDSIRQAWIPDLIFKRDIDSSEGSAPIAGDIIKWNYTGFYYEITHVDNKILVFQGHLCIWECSMKIARFSNQNDLMEEEMLTSNTLPLSGFGDNDFIEEESLDIFNPDTNTNTNIDTQVYGY